MFIKKVALYFVLLHISFQLFSQNWEQVGNFNDAPRVMLNDTVSGLLYFSGNFRFNNNDTVDGFCAYNGSSFTSFGRRFDCNSFGCEPAFMIARYKEQLYLSGPGLTIIDEVNVKGIGKWDGIKWSPGMPGLYYGNDDNPVLDNYAIHDGIFYGVGAFRSAEGDTCNSVAYWDSQKWTGLGFPPWSDNSLPRVFRISFFKGQLYVGGNFSWAQSGGADIAQLDSTGWHMVGGGLKGGISNAFDLQVYKGELYVCGRFNKFEGNAGSGIMRWNGQQWREVGAGFCDPNITVTAMTVHSGRLYVVGNFDCVDNDIPASNIAVWDGEHWSNLGHSVFNNTISCITAYRGEIYVGGGFTEVDGQPCRSLARWVDYENGKPLENGFGLWPNPVRDILQLIAPSPIESVWIIDAAGRTVIQSEEIGDARTSVLVAHLPAGLYFVSVRASEKIWGGKFVKI